MKINQRYNGTIIGGVFTISSLLLTLTIIVPIISIIPGAFIESMMSIVIDSEPYSNIGIATIITLIIIILASLSFFLIRSRKFSFDNRDIIGVMSFEYFFIHTLGFYIYWATSLKFSNDGQLFMGVINSFPVSSFGFVGIGILIDVVKQKKSKDTTTE